MGFEIVVRPSVSPSIRPAPAQPLSPANVTDQSFAIINGSGGSLIDLSYSESRSESHSKPKETKRRVDETRIYKMDDDDGTVDKDTFVDVDVANKIWFDDGSIADYARVQEADNIEIRNPNVMKKRTS
jgi:hypothetical protein